jgi:hypothetical protein
MRHRIAMPPIAIEIIAAARQITPELDERRLMAAAM